MSGGDDEGLATTLGFEDSKELDAICDAFELAWKQNSATQPSLQDYLVRLPEKLRAAAVLELLPIEIAYLGRRGTAIPLDDYRRRFPFVERHLDAWTGDGTKPQSSRLVPGDRLGKYTIAGRLGAGGMGEVYRAIDSSLGRDVAIKVLHARLTWNAEALARIRAEAQALAALKHPSIVTVYAFDEHDGLAYLVLELLEGETLAARLQREPLRPDEVLDRAGQLAAALAAAHDKNIVHRDLKPQNIFLTSDGQTKILDFGLARLLSAPSAAAAEPASSSAHARETAVGARLGTTGYMSPEQVRGEAVDARSDIFTFGSVLLEMVSSEPAFARFTAADSDAAILHELAPQPQSLRQGPLAGLGPIISRCLQKSPQRRYASATELCRNLARVHADYTQRAGRAARLLERSLLAAAAIAIVFLVAWLVAGIVSGIHRDRLRQRFDKIVRDLTMKIESPDLDAVKSAVHELHRLGRELEYPPETVDATVKGAIDSEQHLTYVLGYLSLERGTEFDILRAIESFEATLKVNARFAAAHVGLGECFYRLSSAYRNPDDAMKDVKTHAEAALKLDPNSAPAKVLLALYFHRYQRKWEESKRLFNEALEINPQSTMTLRYYGNSLVLQGETAEGIEKLTQALASDKDSAELEVDLGLAYLYDKQFRTAEQQFRRVLAKDSEYFPAQWALGELYLHQGKYDVAIVELEGAHQLDPKSPEVKAEFLFCFNRLNNPPLITRFRQLASEFNERLESRAGKNNHEPGERYVPLSAWAVVQVGKGDLADAVATLRAAEPARDEWLLWLKIDPVFDRLRGREDFVALYNRLKLWPAIPVPAKNGQPR